MLNPLLFSLSLAATSMSMACPADMVCIARDTDAYSFRFVYPVEAARVAGLDAILRGEATRAEAALAEAAAAGPLARPVRYESAYRLDADLPEIVALSGTVDRDDGGAPQTRAILFDPRNGERLDLVNLFRPETFDTSLFWSRIRGIRAAQDSFCHALSAAVRARRADLQLRELDIRCPDIEDQPITMVCNGQGRILAMRALMGPAASRAVDPDAPAGYVVDFDLTAEMIGTMKRRYRVAFGLPGETRGRSRRSCPDA